MKTLLSRHVDTVHACVDWLNDKFGTAPKVAVITGSSGPSLLNKFDYEPKRYTLELPFDTPVTDGHMPDIMVGSICGMPTIWLMGRLHSNEEAFDPYRSVTSVRALAKWGVETFILTNAVGGINPELKVGNIVLVHDHISSYGGPTPLVGDPDLMKTFGPSRFLDCREVYSKELRLLALEVNLRTGRTPIDSHGVLVMSTGPNIESPAEVRKYHRDGADIVGMSVVHEALALHHMGKHVLALSLVTNMAVHEVAEGTDVFSHDSVQEISKVSEENFAAYIRDIFKAMSSGVESVEVLEGSLREIQSRPY